MSAIAHGWIPPEGSKVARIPKSVATEFHKADLTKGDHLKKLYAGGSFSTRKKNFEDGGSYDSDPIPSYVSASPSAQYLTNNDGVIQASANQGLGSAVTPAVNSTDIGQLTTGLTSGNNSIQNELGSPTTTANLLSDSQLGNSSSGSGGASTGALGSLLKALGLGGSSLVSQGGLTALAGLLGAAGQYKQNSAYAPTYNPPALFGGAYGATGSSSTGSSGYGPPGGYNFRNYQGVGATTPGLGYAPRTAVTPNIPNYYTYGQGGEQPFYSGTSAQIPAAKRGGRIMKKWRGGSTTPQRFDAGGSMALSGGMGMPQMGTPHPMGALPMPQAPGPLNGAPMPPRPQIGPPRGPQPSPMANAQPMRIPLQRPMMRAEGGASAPDDGALSSVARHVKGPGDGTSDSIPARLANGEYVMDAQTVSMLGNGDNGAGAKQLDSFRENIRKHKGEALAKGKMAPDAHPNLMRYLGGKV